MDEEIKKILSEIKADIAAIKLNVIKLVLKADYLSSHNRQDAWIETGDISKDTGLEINIEPREES